MATTQRQTVVGVFTDHTTADRAIADLKKAGFRDDQIGVAGRDMRNETKAKEEGSLVEEGALAGALTGAAGGALIGLGILAGVIPAIGPIVAGGALGALLANAAGGAAIAGLIGALVGLGIPEEEAQYYESEFKSGRVIVTVKSEDRYDEAMTILRRHGAWDRSSTRADNVMNAATQQTAGSQKVELKEEELHARKQQVQTGEVRVRKEVTTEHRTIDVPVQREEIVIERHPVGNQPAAHSDFRTGEEVRIPVMEEQVHVEKHAVVKEEVTVGKRKIQDTKHVSGTVRKEQVRVEKEGDVNVHGSTTNVTKGKKK